MRQLILNTFFCFLAVICFGQSNSKAELMYKPKNLDEAVFQLEKIFHDTTKLKIMAMTEGQFISNFHFSLGIWIRNNWELWKGGELSKYFNSIGIFHPDDMSGIIMTSYYRHLKGIDRDLDKQVENYQDHWKAANEHFNKLKTDTAYKRQVRERLDSVNIERLNKKKAEWTANKVVTGYLGYQCGFIDLGEQTKVKGTILRWDGNKLIIKIVEYFEEKKKKRVIKCNAIQNDMVIIYNHEYFSLVE
ncbi:MAG: DUF6794 domain-containing protein [Candidatus Methylacidiphilales bacterium]